MKKYILIVVIAVFCTNVSYGQRIKKFNFEPFIGINLPIKHIEDCSNKIGPTLGFEFRYNFENQPFSIGGEINCSVAVREFSYLSNVTGEYEDDNLALRNISLSFTADYKWNQLSKISPFMGASLGLSVRDMTSPHSGKDYGGTNRIGPNLTLRGGIEFFHRFRTSMVFVITNKRYNVISGRIGYVF